MFASCPNFNTHYTEDAVNNNGLEWIRFLNEVLSDYDDLLNEPRFKTVIKIKTVGSTYMAASGINLEKPITKVLFNYHLPIILICTLRYHTIVHTVYQKDIVHLCFCEFCCVSI